jgi:hypothetical protein
MEGSIRTTKGQKANKGKTNNKRRLITKEGYPKNKYKRNNRVHKYKRGDCKNQEEYYP